MSRIRSIHPGIWTDEAFMELSPSARLLLIGIWTEAWDDGVFEWKPLRLKARIFPVDAVDVTALLGELFDAGVIARIEQSPKQPGVIKNFQRYQRPKKPNSSGMMRDEWLDYVGAKATPEPSDDDIPEPVPHQFPTSGEKSPQMEDGGGRMKEEERKAPPSPPRGEAGDLWNELEAAYPFTPNTDFIKAKRLFMKLPPEDQIAAHAAARPYEIATREDRQRRGRSAEDHAQFIPGLDTWLRDRKFRAAAPAQSMATLPVLRQDDPLVPVIERMRGKPIIFGTKGTTTVTTAELDQARASS